MIRDITVGQYYPADSVLHKLDPRVKFTGTVIYIIALFLVHSYGYLICLAALVTLIILSKVPVKFILKGLKPVAVILAITAVLNIFLTKGTYLWQWGILHISAEGIRLAVSVAVRLILLVISASLLTLTTTPTKLTDGLESLFGPLKKIKVPVHEVAMMISIALRFIPVLLEETDRIMKAQTARGADFESGGLVKKVKAMIPLLIPLFVSAFRRADELAMAMEARCYHGSEGRTQMKPLHYSKSDIAGYIICCAFLAAVILLHIFLGW